MKANTQKSAKKKEKKGGSQTMPQVSNLIDSRIDYAGKAVLLILNDGTKISGICSKVLKYEFELNETISVRKSVIKEVYLSIKIK